MLLTPYFRAKKVASDISVIYGSSYVVVEVFVVCVLNLLLSYYTCSLVYLGRLFCFKYET